MKRVIYSAAVLSAMTFAGACGSDKSTGPSDSGTGATATAADVSGMMAALSALGAFSFNPTGFTGHAPSGPGLALQAASYPFDVTTNCPSGGSVHVSGNYSYSLNGSAYTYNGTLTEAFNGCKATGNGTVYTFANSSWSVTFSMNYNLSAGTYTYNLHETGNMNWASPSKSGGCPINITVTASSGGGTPTYTFSGTYCGISIS